VAVDIQCAGCRRRFRVADKFAGKRVKCPNCSVPIRVPALSKTETPARPPGPAPPVGEATRRREEQESPPAETGETSTQSTDADDVDTIVEAHSFGRMSGGRRPGEEQARAFVRSGTTGGWRRHFTTELEIRYRETLGDFPTDLGLPPLDW